MSRLSQVSCKYLPPYPKRNRIRRRTSYAYATYKVQHSTDHTSCDGTQVRYTKSMRQRKSENQNQSTSLLSVASGNKYFEAPSANERARSTRELAPLRGHCTATPRAPPDPPSSGRRSCRMGLRFEGLCLQSNLAPTVQSDQKSETNASASRVSPANQCTEDSPSSWMTSVCARPIPIRRAPRTAPPRARFRSTGLKR